MKKLFHVMLAHIQKVNLEKKSSEIKSLITNNYWAVFSSLIIVILMKFSELSSFSVLYYFGFLLLSLPLIKIENVVLLIPFSLLLMAQAPQKIGPSEIYFSLLFLIAIAHFICKKYKEFNFKNLQKESLFFCAVLFFFIVNFFRAISNAVDIFSWFRGAVPFFTCLLFLPLSKTFSENKSLSKCFFYVIGIVLVLYAAQVIAYYIAYGLHKKQWYFFKNNEWIRITHETVKNYPKESIFFFKQRITSILPESTNPFVPLGCIMGQILFSFSKKTSVSAFSIVLIIISTVATTMTMTRSMLLSILIVSFPLFLLFCKPKYRIFLKRNLFSIALVTSIFTASIFLLDAKDVYLNRFLQMASFIETTQRKTVDSIDEKTKRHTPNLKDENINTRINEYQEALRIFYNYPFFGAGFGIKHKILLDTGFGNMVLHEVGYIHNWALYFLMCGGIYGFALYSIILFYPFVFTIKTPNYKQNTLLGCSLVFLIIYSCFFAVFRLISFNFLLAIFWAVIYKKNIRKDSKACAV